MGLKVIPAHPLALTCDRKLDELHQRALTRYYLAAGVDGLAVGVHTTQFAIREAGLFEPVLRIAREEIGTSGVTAIAGVCGPTAQAVREAELAASLGYDAVLLSLGALANANTRKLVEHTQAVAAILPERRPVEAVPATAPKSTPGTHPIRPSEIRYSVIVHDSD